MPVPLVATLDNPYGPQITFETENVLPPSAFYVSPDDGIYLTVLTTDLNVQLNFIMRFLTPQGEVKVDSFSVPIPTGTPGTSSLQIPPVEGYILSANVVAANQQPGNCFVQVQIVRGIPQTPANAGYVMIQGYITAMGALCWPNQSPAAPFTGPGQYHTQVQTPAAGAEVVFVPPSRTRWRVQSFTAIFTASAAAGNRVPNLAIQTSDGTTALYIPCFANVGPSAGGRQQWYVGAPYAAAPDGAQQAPLPNPCFVAETGSVQTVTEGLQAGDRWQNATLAVEQWSGR